MINSKFQTPNSKLRTPNSERGVILITVLILIIAVSIYLPAYVTWTIWDQRGLIRQQRAEEANAFAQAGLYRAKLDLFMDTDSWLDGEINNWTVNPPVGSSPDQFWTLYASPNWTLWDGSLGSYTVWIDYLQRPSCTPPGCTDPGCCFFDKRMRVRSTGRVTGAFGILAFSTLEQYVNYYVVKNITWTPPDRFYASLQQAINEALGGGRLNDTIGITAATLRENIAINWGNLTIQGCWDPTFTFRSCSNYHTTIQGNWTVTGTADVNLSGVTID